MPSTSKAQQRLMGQAYALKKGEIELKDIDAEYRDEIKDLADSMSLSDLKDFAETKHEGLPNKVAAENLTPGSLNGMGPVTLPAGQTVGSGDVPAGSGDAEEEYKKKKRQMKHLSTFEAFVNEAYTEDDINMSYGFYGQIEANFDEKKAKKLFDQGVKDLQKKYKLTEEEALGVLNSKMGRKAADQIYDEQAKTAVEGLETYYGKSLHKEIAAVQRSLVYEGYSFDYQGTTVKNPFTDETARMDVDPIKYYGKDYAKSDIKTIIEATELFVKTYTEWKTDQPLDSNEDMFADYGEYVKPVLDNLVNVVKKHG